MYKPQAMVLVSFQGCFMISSSSLPVCGDTVTASSQCPAHKAGCHVSYLNSIVPIIIHHICLGCSALHLTSLGVFTPGRADEVNSECDDV